MNTEFLHIAVEIDGVVQKMDTLARQADELEEPLRRFGAYLRGKTIARFDAQGFAPLAKTTLEGRVSRGLHSLEKKLSRDVKRANTRMQKSAESLKLKDTLKQTRGVMAREAVLADFQRRHGRSWSGRRSGLVSDSRLGLTLGQMASLSAREERAVDRAVGRPVLGQLKRSPHVEVSGNSMTLSEVTATGWSNVHNEGGQAGHGARIPKRETLKLEAGDLRVLGSILKEHLLVAFDSDLQGPGF